jgi:hypothetical protein
MIAIDKLIPALRELSDEVFQQKAWLASSGPTVSSFSEQISQTFDDTGLSDALDAGQRPAVLTDESFSVLKELDKAVRRIDQSLPPQALLRNSRVKEVRVLARRALELLEAK